MARIMVPQSAHDTSGRQGAAEAGAADKQTRCPSHAGAAAVTLSLELSDRLGDEDVELINIGGRGNAKEIRQNGGS